MAKFNRKVREIKDVISQAKYGTEGLKLCLHHGNRIVFQVDMRICVQL